jgi:hypothetical protein
MCSTYACNKTEFRNRIGKFNFGPTCLCSHDECEENRLRTKGVGTVLTKFMQIYLLENLQVSVNLPKFRVFSFIRRPNHCYCYNYYHK